VRQYSLCGTPDGSYRIAVKKLPGGRGGSVEVHEAMIEGLEVTISEPRNNFELCDAQRHVLIAGGIGVTPLLAMARHLGDEGKTFELHLCAPDSESVPFGATLNELPFSDRISIHVDSAPGRASIEPVTHVGRWESGAEIYMCGPAGFMDWLQSSAVELGWPLDTIHRESFTAPVVDVTNTRPFEIVLARAGVTLQVPAGRPILDVLVENKFEMPSGCGQGVCGSCVTPVLEGELEHRDAVLPAAVRAANTAMCICVSRAKCDRIVLDI
jgi:vanillate O-demethylase ferredoxin subunit